MHVKKILTFISAAKKQRMEDADPARKLSEREDSKVVGSGKPFKAKAVASGPKWSKTSVEMRDLMPTALTQWSKSENLPSLGAAIEALEKFTHHGKNHWYAIIVKTECGSHNDIREALLLLAKMRKRAFDQLDRRLHTAALEDVVRLALQVRRQTILRVVFLTQLRKKRSPILASENAAIISRPQS
jgi:hypothetical protein